MHHNYYLSPLAVALALGIASSARAAEPMPLQKASLNQVKQKFALTIQGISAAKDSLQFVSEHTDVNKVTHVRMQQQYVGFPVYGGYAIMHSMHTVKSLGKAQENVSMNGVVYQGLQTELGQPDASFVKNADTALELFKAKYAGKEVSEGKVIPMVYIDSQHKAHWAYKVSALVTHKDKIPERPTAIIDAKTNQAFVQWNDIKTQSRDVVKGSGFGGNNKIGFIQYGSDLPYLDITRDSHLSSCFMENSAVKVIDMDHKYSSRSRAMKFNCSANDAGIYLTGYKGDGYDKENGAASPTNDALYAGHVIHYMYQDWYNTNALSNADGSPMKLVMRVHYGEGYENAYWDGQQMTFGDGDTMMYPLVSLGVAAHEISHGFTEQHSNLEYYGQSGGMNEAFSDMAAQAAEYYSVNKSTWQIGGEIMKEDSGYDALRYMDLPSRDGESIDTADEYYGGLDVHYSSGVYNHLFYIMANQPSWNTRLAFDVMVKANMDYWTPYSNFDEGGEGLVSAINDLVAADPNHVRYPATAVCDVKKSLNEVKIVTNMDGCTSN
ncbi:M4 family metallopeptidase [Fluoribacter dumoffii]|uniref:Neutral metalloproteinase n=3 Tax=Fluoribacter dumoffii TaxID=463 RepID=A0A377GDF2_9GAMM|nr:M4 family metallopeptidase [Fluoribacter dumoffii]KTC90967.1 zinc metalloproteinase precursor [Fluoribacter dumoffii NY 23]MCW8386536.1 M4 family metallopeptidase [Fluoribacter dumoffii]MCW8498190.1 M4 family metallopeptidase [Fluoribacter dumoffii]STO22540.1 Zinc metalloproteinase precursor [Fluoribacter dumoffii]